MGEQQGASPRNAFRQIASSAAHQQPSLASAALPSIVALQLRFYWVQSSSMN